MMTAIDRILNFYRDAAVTEREKGTYFERLGLAFFRHDPVQAEEYEAVWTWSDWAKENGWDGRDVGIDLVAKLRNEDEGIETCLTYASTLDDAQSCGNW
ncbi:restriction endonuclease [Seohaeicola sp. 4SK31]|uniref:restriction endonuclease n=2 Tax=unclassified Seohaeicola TaxID=2641111 RepID=UPI00237C339D|nr:hypothetical protein [Seohaeicola sp. 4SK31]